MGSPFLELPVEVLEHIADVIDYPSDLLAFGLTCKASHKLTIPFPLAYRQIWWPTHQSIQAMTPGTTFSPLVDPGVAGSMARALMDHLSEQPRRYHAIRSLIISRKESQQALRFLSSTKSWDVTVHHTASSQGPYESEEGLLSRGIRQMSRLRSFIWDSADPDVEGPLWTALEAATSMVELDFRLDHHDYPTGGGDIRDGGDVVVNKIADLAKSAGDLESLSTRACNSFTAQLQPSFDATPFLSGRWPRLRRLHLNGAHGSADEVALFVSHHSTITDLSIIGYDFDLSMVRLDSLPFLISLEVFAGVGSALLQPLPSGKSRPLQKLILHRVSLPGHTETPAELFPSYLGDFATTLSWLQFEQWDHVNHNDLDYISKAVPDLSYLRIPEDNIRANLSSHGLHLDRSQQSQIEDWARRFILFPQLKTLSLGLKWSPSYIQRGAVMQSGLNAEAWIVKTLSRIAPEVRLKTLTYDRMKGVTFECERHSPFSPIANDTLLRTAY